MENVTGDLLWSCNLAIRHDLFERLGGFNEDFLEAGGEDVEFAWRIRQMKVTVRYVPEALVFHQARRLPFWRWINRSFQSRWHLLYLLKTDRTDCATLGTGNLLATLNHKNTVTPGANPIRAAPFFGSCSSRCFFLCWCLTSFTGSLTSESSSTRNKPRVSQSPSISILWSPHETEIQEFKYGKEFLSARGTKCEGAS